MDESRTVRRRTKVQSIATLVSLIQSSEAVFVTMRRTFFKTADTPTLHFRAWTQTHDVIRYHVWLYIGFEGALRLKYQDMYANLNLKIRPYSAAAISSNHSAKCSTSVSCMVRSNDWARAPGW